MSRRWLLMLGSNLDTDANVRAAIVALGALGPVRVPTPVRPTPSTRGDGCYHNALVELDCGLQAPLLRQRLQVIEAALGRVRDGSGVVAIDIDVLARDDGQGWQADAHAIEKGEFARPPAPQLLAEAGIVLP